MMRGDALILWPASALLLSLRIAPAFALAPPFTLVRTPPLLRVLFGLALAATLVAAQPDRAMLSDLGPGNLVVAAVRELALGATVVLALHLTYGALYVAGRTVDIQAGFGLAMLIDPTTRNQTPLVGALFAYAAGAVFFAMNGHIQLMRILAASLQAIPLGGTYALPTVGHIAAFMSGALVTALGVCGGLILCLFLADLAIAMLSRTTPQMNVLVLGFQVKTLLLLLVMPLTMGLAGALLARMTAATLEALPRLL